MNKRIISIIAVLLLAAGSVFQKAAFPESQDNQTQQNPQSISSQDLERGWYYGSFDQKKPGMPDDWVHDFEGTRSACWHKAGIRCGQGPKKRPCAQQSEMCGGIAGILCCPVLDCKLSGNYPDASGVCTAQTSTSTCEPGKEYKNTAVEPVKCKCPEDYEFKVVEMGWGPCPHEGMGDCPASVLKCVSIK